MDEISKRPKAGHTPGPWVTYREPVGGDTFILRIDGPKVTGHRPMFIASLYGSISDIKAVAEVGANAHLMAAAPELLEALRLVLPVLVSAGTEVAAQVVRDAIAKAEGRS